MKEIVERVNEKLDRQNFVTLACAKDKISNSSSGFYWIYTKLQLSSFVDLLPPSRGSKHIDFSEMAKVHGNLEYIIQQSNQDCWCIYNGKGKNLNQRLSAEFSKTAPSTGKLALTRCFEENDFRVKYIICEHGDHNYGIAEDYATLEKDLERTWRLHYGWPFLCRT